MTLERKRQIMTVIKYVVLILVGVIMICLLYTSDAADD